MPSLFTPDQRAAFECDGFVMVRTLFDAEETGLLRSAIEQDPHLRASLYDRKDAQGKSTRMALWNHPGDSVYGLAARSHRVVDTMARMELVYAEMEPGDGLFFHANVMHRSDQNRSPDWRRTVLFCYNAARNNPYLEHQHPCYTPLVKVPDSAVRAAGVKLAGAADQFRSAPVGQPNLPRTCKPWQD